MSHLQLVSFTSCAAIYRRELTQKRKEVLKFQSSMKRRIILIFSGICLAMFVLALILRITFILKKAWRKASKKTKKFIGFFHPNCSSGGGGERVLWLMVCSLLREKNSCNNVDIVIYTGDLDSNEVDHVMLLEFVPFDYLFAPHLFACVLS